MSSLYLRGKKSVWIGFTDKDGIRHDKATGYKLDPVIRRGDRIVWPRHILDFQKQLDEAIILGKWGLKFDLPKSVKLSEAFQEFVEFKSPKRSPSTLRAHQLAFRKLKDMTGDCHLQSITEERMIRVRDAFIAQDGLSNAANWLRHLSAFFNFCVSRKKIDESPITENVKLAQPDTEILIWSETELEDIFAFIEWSDGTPAAEQLRYQLLSGWRIGDNVALKVVKIDYERRIIKHYIGKKRKYFEYPMDDELHDFLRPLPTYGEHQFKYRSTNTMGHIFKAALRAVCARGVARGPPPRM